MRFAEHLTRLLERELEREHVEAELTSQTNLSAVLNRVLRHNLRNDIAVIRANIQQIAEQLPDQTAVNTTFDHVDTLLDLSEKARELERIITSDFERQPTAVGRLVENIVESTGREYPHASLSVEYDEDISTALRPSFERAITELLENAIEHSGETPTVSVTIETVPNAIEIQIADDGPGLPDMEAEVLTTGEETPLSHGSGLGLWLIHWIVTGHDGSIDTTVTDNGTTVTLSIPRSPNISIQQQEPEITRGRDRFHAAFEEAHDTIVILDDDARILNSNRAAETLFGLASKELLGRSLPEFASETFDFEAEWRDFQQTGSIRGTLRLVDAGGEEHVVEYTGKANIVTGEHLFVGRDITERKERERELALTRRMFERVQHMSSAASFEFDLETGHLRRHSGIDELDGLTPGHLATVETALQHVHPDDRERVRARMQEITETASDYDIEYRAKYGEETIRWYRSVAEVVTTEGHPILRGMIRDITERKEREQRIQQERDRFQSVFEGAFDAIVITDEEGEYIEVNESATRLFGCEKEELIGKSIRDFAPEDFSFDELWEEFTQSEQERGTFPLVRPDGSRRTVEYAATPDIIESQHLSILRDITERDERERELMAMKERYETLLAAAPDPVFVADAETGEIIEINEAAETLLGESRDQIIGRHQSTLHPEEDAELYREAFERATGGRETIQAFPDGSRPKLVTADNETIPIEISVNTIPLPDGPVIYGIFRDISARDKREELRQVIDLVPDLIFAKNREGEYLLANETTAEVYGLSPEEVEGNPESELLPDARASERFHEDDLEVIETDESKEIPEEELTTVDGETKTLQTVKIPYEIPGTGEDAVLGYARDVTELKEYQRVIEEQRDSLEVLNQVVRHDIRNDLQLVTAYAEMLEDYVEEGGEEYVRQVREAAREAVDITTTARDITEVLLQQDTDRSPTGLDRVIESEVKGIRSSNERALVTVEPLPRVKVLADDMLESLIRNLLKNAIVHNDKEVPKVTVSATTTDSVARIQVADNGPGIPDGQKETIFGKGEAGLDSQGSGIGLYLVQTLVDRYGGDVWVEANDPQGSVFVVELPLVDE
ncbi:MULTISPECIES: PAS domain S-box protein [Salinibaculum]|uniref:PAS domain S-box protein n=1 Tax=Salinibaculum TaxID=2732368 RepID=UPI0030D3D4B0